MEHAHDVCLTFYVPRTRIENDVFPTEDQSLSIDRPNRKSM